MISDATINIKKRENMARSKSITNTVYNDIKNMFTGKDNKTLDLGRVLWAKAVVAYLCVAFYNVYNGATIDFIAFGTGIAAVLAAGGAAIGLKAGTEPDTDGDGNPG